MNEIEVRHFQIKPPNVKPNHFDQRPCVFMNDGFDMNDIRFISGVRTYEGISLFWFDVTFDDKSIKTYRFPYKASAIKCQRELQRAYTMTEEFAYVKVGGDEG